MERSQGSSENGAITRATMAVKPTKTTKGAADRIIQPTIIPARAA